MKSDQGNLRRALCATIGETTPSEKLVYIRGQGRGGTCLIAGTLGTRSASVGTCFCPTWDSFQVSGDSFQPYSGLLGTRGDSWDSFRVGGDSFWPWLGLVVGQPLCATIGETTPSEKLVYNRGRGNDGTRLIANQRRPISTAKVKAQYQSRRLYPAPSTGRTSRSTAHAAGGPRSAGGRHRLGDGGANLVRRRMLTP